MSEFPKEGRIYVDQDYFRRGLRLAFYYEESLNPLKVVAIDSWNTVEVGEGAVGPTALNLTMAQGQELMDRLWSCGVRPSEGMGSVGQLGAMERHLEDMRSLVFKTEAPKRGNR